MARKSKEDSFSCPQGLPLTLVSLIHVLAGFCFRAPVLTKASSSDICANFYDQEKKKKKATQWKLEKYNYGKEPAFDTLHH